MNYIINMYCNSKTAVIFLALLFASMLAAFKPYGSIFAVTVIYGWFFVIGWVVSSPELHPQKDKNRKLLILFFICMVIFLCLTALGFEIVGFVGDVSKFIVMIMHFSILIFISKRIASFNKKGNKPAVESTIGLFLLLWFYPAGCLVVHPIVQEIYKSTINISHEKI